MLKYALFSPKYQIMSNIYNNQARETRKAGSSLGVEVWPWKETKKGHPFLYSES